MRERFREKGSKKLILTMWIRITRKYKCHIMTRGSFHKNLNSIQDESFRGCTWMDDRWQGRRTQLLKSVTNILQCWNLAQSCFTLRRSKRHINHATHSMHSADISIFSPKISNFCYIKKNDYRLHFNS